MKEKKEKYWCSFCGKEHTCPPLIEWKGENEYSHYKFCSRECADKYRKRYGRPSGGYIF